jgi:Fe-S-cluster containining protein
MVPESLPLHMTPMVRAWACRKRGLCCKYQQVQIDEVERRRLERKLEEVGDPLHRRLASENVQYIDGWAVLPRVDKNCALLGEDNLCTVRKRFGMSAYPEVCKKFPYLSILTDDRQLVGLTFQCPTALQLLAEESQFELVVELDTEPPVERVAFVNSPTRTYFDVRGNPVDCATFWKGHWELFERFRQRPETDPVLRLTAFAEAETGEEAPAPAVVRRDIWIQGAFEPSVERELTRLAGEIPPGLPWLWINFDAQAYTLDPLPPLDQAGEHSLVMRYLMHRMLMPISYISICDPRFLISTMFAMVARYRIERARGHDPVACIRQLDRFFVHTSNPGAIFGSESTFFPWRAMASLARAVTVG